jgi:multidrug efflux pump
LTAPKILADLRRRLASVKDAFVLPIAPPPVQGLGSAGGFKLMVEDQNNLGPAALAQAVQKLVIAANKDPDLANVFTLFSTGSPSVYADIDRTRAEKLGLTPGNIFDAMQIYLGSTYINDFNYLGRTYEVIAQADAKSRKTSLTSPSCGHATPAGKSCPSARWPV